MTTLDLDALERAARAATDKDAPFAVDVAFEKHFPPEVCLSLVMAHRALQERVEGVREALEQADFWLEGALNCKTWNWDDDQRAAATDSLAVIRAARAKAGEPHE